MSVSACLRGRGQEGEIEIKRKSVERRGIVRSKPVLEFVRRNIKGKEKKSISKTREEVEKQTDEGNEAGGECTHWGGIKIQREEKSKSSRGRHAEVQERTKERNVSGRDCVTAARRRSR